MTETGDKGPYGPAAMLVVAISAVALGGCSMSGGAPQPKSGSVRSTGDTAPADLQLVCASEAASRLNINGGVLPVSSMRAPDGTYQVNLTMGGGQAAVCFIDTSGVVRSVERV